MSAEETRPDPDTLLRRVKAESERERRAKLRIFFGFAPGVGKTYRMLLVARELAGQGADLAVGYVERHKRPETAALLLGLELLPNRKAEHRGHVLEEFDLDAALARKPKIILVDELAHSNAPGSRHAKRWQDVMELLDAGIDVFTTLNVQHVESLNDVVAQITHVQVRETVPDSVLERADEVELVDIGPEELLERLREGKVYLPDQAARATQHFFQRGKLLALRELALRRVAERVDADVAAYRDEHGVEAKWGAGERILACVGPSPASANVIRVARRTAAGLRAPWVAACAEDSGRAPMSDANRERLETHLRLAESLGATVVRLNGPGVAEAILTYARQHNVTRILVGKPTHSRLRDRLRGSLLDAIVRSSGDIDVHVVAGEPGVADATPQAAPGSMTLGKYGWTAASVAGATGLGLLSQAFFPVPDLEMLYLLVIMAVAAVFGRGPAILASALGVACYDFFFVEPYLTFAVTDVRYVLTFGVMFGVGLVTSELAVRLRRQGLAALAREQHTAALYALSRDIGAAQSASEVAAATARHAEEAFGCTACVLIPGTRGDFAVLHGPTPAADLASPELAVAKWAIEHSTVAGVGTDTLPGSGVMCVPLTAGALRLGAVLLRPTAGKALDAQQRGFLEALCRQSALALERSRLAEEARAAALRARTEELRSSLLSAVSHDLRTPLAAITGSATTLRDGGTLTEETRHDLIDAICDEAERLERLVANLLDMTRLESGGIQPRREWVPLEEIVGSALARLEKRLSGRTVSTSLASGLPLVSVDPVLFEQVFVNLLENAAKYTPPGSPLEITASVSDAGVEVVVADRGPGLKKGDESRVFEKFYRGAHTGIGGAGLGLPICRGIVEAHGGRVAAANRKGGGAEFRIVLPAGSSPPAMRPERQSGAGDGPLVPVVHEAGGAP